MHKLTRAQQVAWAKQQLTVTRGCPLCQQSWTVILARAKEKGLRQAPYVVDHDHLTGEVRGLLCRSCNGCDGKVTTAIATWGKAGRNTENIICYMERLAKYLRSKGHGILYSTHVLEEDRVAKQAAARKQVAAKRAAARLKRP